MNINDFVFVCVGDSSVLFDCLGPLVGDNLKQKNFPAPVLGSTQFPITTKNIKLVIEEIKKVYTHKKIVIIDSTCLNLSLPCERDDEFYKQTNFLDQVITLKKGKVDIVNINYSCGDYNILCKTFTIKNQKIKSANINEILQLANRICAEIHTFFKVRHK